MSPGSREYCASEIDKCPTCGKQKMATAKLCGECHKVKRAADAKDKHKPCPHCGKQIDVRASMCLPCHNARQGKGKIEAAQLPPIRIMLTAGHSIFDEPTKYAKPSEFNDDD